MSITPSTKGASNALKWLGTKTGEYTVKTGYYTAMAERCGNLESINHLIFHCPFAREVWKLAPLDGSFGISGLTDLRADWNDLHRLGCLPPTGLTPPPLVPWILWALWKARNRFVFENFSGSPADVLSQAIVLAREWSAAQDKKETVRSDAAWSAVTKNVGLGWVVVIREQKTLFKLGISFTPSALVAEALAMKEATCCRLGVKDVRFDSDSRLLINAINGKDPLLEIYGVVEDIHILSNAFDVVSFAWLSRERNGEADLLAKNALSLYEQGVVVATLMPPPN
ncbi:hypothetical protein IGI04_019998 [Brassica rapa subsp. trilocularis]|uniref:RNase H type-1 domain-containing protein n=1 Tax=Brassica rapa subsp. trilocularis TaxID=1813537 RepID=A0ABQ7MHI5_BRACM|nr:hypothetical protein IGI04_019998 [Brassica rapa subsp. trilocularis]